MALIMKIDHRFIAGQVFDILQRNDKSPQSVNAQFPSFITDLI